MMITEKLFKRQEILKLVEKYFGESEIGLEHLNGQLYVFFHGFLVDKILFTQEIDVFIPFEEVYMGQKINEKSYLRDKIVLEQYIEFYFEKEENFPTMSFSSKKVSSMKEAHNGMKKNCEKMMKFLEGLSSKYDGEVKYTYQDRRYKDKWLQKKAFHTPTKPEENTGPASMGYFVEEKLIENEQLLSKDTLEIVCVKDSLLEIFEKFYEFIEQYD
ncbi:MAG: hypothetical protein H7647_03310 [Candidatus Heimdallarchaeota archaeon]|nr:hypothetical protein [Candidatus Heimdallarchaeota archaeon]MCK4253456.1 hypothetical protein [Candidatus Heimdallarchaeota archaeon]